MKELNSCMKEIKRQIEAGQNTPEARFRKEMTKRLAELVEKVDLIMLTIEKNKPTK